MDLFVLDELLRRKELIDQYESLIWTERFAAYGDFELVIQATRGIKALLLPGTRLALDRSYRVMKVETAESTVDSEGKAVLKITGRSLESELEDRTTLSAQDSGGVGGVIIEIVDTPGEVARYIFDSRCRTNLDIPEDNLPYLALGSFLPAGSIPEYADLISFSALEPKTVYSVIKELCDAYDLGFRLVLNPNTNTLHFDIYTGDDHTTLQNVLPPVIFSPELENLSNPSELTSVAQLKNVAYVFAQNSTAIVYADNVSPTVAGFERRVLIVDMMSNSDPAGAELTALLQQKGREELAKYRPVIAFDGEVPTFKSYVYGVDYNLGDLLEMRNSGADGLATNMRVVEQIFVCDAEGERSYPTLIVNLLITPGTWYAWDASQVWDDADEFWEDA